MRSSMFLPAVSVSSFVSCFSLLGSKPSRLTSSANARARAYVNMYRPRRHEKQILSARILCAHTICFSGGPARTRTGIVAVMSCMCFHCTTGPSHHTFLFFVFLTPIRSVSCYRPDGEQSRLSSPCASHGIMCSTRPYIDFYRPIAENIFLKNLKKALDIPRIPWYA